MPCAAACTRLPCDERCDKFLPCGHRCPSLCGEDCPEGFCQDCGERLDARVDLLEMKTYAETDVGLTPIVVLGCGHFFTAETLDGLVGMHMAYTSDREGRFTGLVDLAGTFTKIPQCPDCQRPVRQFVTRRYNRIINRAVADESAKRFLVSGQNELQDLNTELMKLQKDLTRSSPSIIRSIKILSGTRRSLLEPQLLARYDDGKKLQIKINSFRKRSSNRYQPSHKLYKATICALQKQKAKALGDGLATLSLESSSHGVERDCRVTLTGEMALLKLEFTILEDMLSIARALNSATLIQSLQWPGGSPLRRVQPFMDTSASFIASCGTEALPKLAVEATLYHGRMAHMYQSCSSLDGTSLAAKAMGFVEDAKANLESALLLCEQPFQHSEVLKGAVQDIIRLLQRERYETVSAEEIAAIKKAMVSGSGGIATHSGHWYNCENGHPVSVFF